jgi:hypothetical protein
MSAWPGMLYKVVRNGGQRTMTHKVKFTHSNKSREHVKNVELREGKEVYQHPKGYFVVLEFEGRSGKFREAFWPEEVVKQELFL